MEAVTSNVPLGLKHNAEIGLLCALNCATTDLETRSRTMTCTEEKKYRKLCLVRVFINMYLLFY